MYCVTPVLKISRKGPVWSWRMVRFDKLNFFSFGLADDQQFFNAPCNNMFFGFLMTLQEEFPPIKSYLCWIYISEKINALKTIKFSFSAILWNLLRSKFWNHLQAEKIPCGPIFLDFPIVFQMVWKNQENCKSWLVGFWVIRRSKKPKFQLTIFFAFLRHHYWITNYFEISNFIFSNIKARGVLTC